MDNTQNKQVTIRLKGDTWKKLKKLCVEREETIQEFVSSMIWDAVNSPNHAGPEVRLKQRRGPR